VCNRLNSAPVFFDRLSSNLGLKVSLANIWPWEWDKDSPQSDIDGGRIIRRTTVSFEGSASYIRRMYIGRLFYDRMILRYGVLEFHSAVPFNKYNSGYNH